MNKILHTITSMMVVRFSGSHQGLGFRQNGRQNITKILTDTDMGKPSKKPAKAQVKSSAPVASKAPQKTTAQAGKKGKK